MAAWISLDEALQRKRKPFPKPFQRLNNFSGIGNIGAELRFGTVSLDCAGEQKLVPAMVIVHHIHKDVVGPLMCYWFALWHKSYGYVEFDIRWLWNYLGEAEPCDWMAHRKCQLKVLAEVRDALLRVPEDRRNEFVEGVGVGRFLREEGDFP